MSMKGYWPLSDRQIHYLMLNEPEVLRNTKLRTRYKNDDKSYNDLTNILTRMRVHGLIRMDTIADPTRPSIEWQSYASPAPFFKKQLRDMFGGYFRDLMQSQSHHIEIVAEKLTVEPIIRSIAAEYTIPLNITRGQASLPLRYKVVQRFHESGKDSLVRHPVLIVG